MDSAGRRRPAAQRRRRSGGKRRGVAAVGTGVAALAGGVLAIMTHSHPAARPVASDCGLVTCTAAVPSPVLASITAGPQTSASHKPRHKPAGHKDPRAHPTSTPRPATMPVVAPAATPAGPSPTYTVDYSVVQRRSGGFQGRLIITNHGNSVLNGWRLTITLPGDQVTSAWGSAYQTNGDSVTFGQALLQGGILPGSSLTLNFDANGNTTSPSSCTLDGTTCAA